jgi:multisubunit Na+/H+ antiporter MnhB subunit
MRIEPFRNPRNRDAGWRARRLIDIGSIVAVLAVMLVGYYYLTRPDTAPTQTSFIVPSQHVHW